MKFLNDIKRKFNLKKIQKRIDYCSNCPQKKRLEQRIEYLEETLEIISEKALYAQTHECKNPYDKE